MMTTIEKEQATEPEFVLSRTFDARRERVWRAFTDSEAMRHWWGHAGAKVIAGQMDLRVGGTYVYGLQTPGQPEMWGRFTYREIAAPEKLVAENCFSDPQG